jgi:predicted regulator of Ras-like GTPase activity (Roadblock/LC7/MglB family)
VNDELAGLLKAYRQDEGIRAALLVGRDGFPVAFAAEAGIDATAVAAQVADMLGVCHRLALELGQQETRYITFELTGLNVVVAPFEGDLLLVLVGEPEALRLSYSLRDGA